MPNRRWLLAACVFAAAAGVRAQDEPMAGEEKAEARSILYADIKLSDDQDAVDAKDIIEAASVDRPNAPSPRPAASVAAGQPLLLEFTGLDAPALHRLEGIVERMPDVELTRREGKALVWFPSDWTPGSDPRALADVQALLGTRLAGASLSFGADPSWFQQTVPDAVSTQALNVLAPELARAHDRLVFGDAALACRQASNRIGALRFLSEPVGGEGDDARIVSLADRLGFDGSCLGRIVPDREMLAAPAYVRDSRALRVLGVLEYEEVLPDGRSRRSEFCSGFLVDPATVVSARHCFYDVDAPTMRNARGNAWARGQVYFRRLSPPYESIGLGHKLALGRLDAALDPAADATELAAGDDVIAFALQAPATDVPRVSLQDAAAPSDAWIAGPTGVVREDPENAGVPRSVLGVRWSKNAACALIPEGDACLAHVCQLTAGASGAPFVSGLSSADAVVVVGMHLGPYASLGTSCPTLPQPDLQAGMNGAVRAGTIAGKLAAAHAIAATPGER